ncbi:hypothetical protein H4R18_003341 [Coemansia javaensis]|uniref:F-box domain-containing protein n=1 Tax=Coemansia javaensis TaxID=2761396 RepID=A0A9W8LIK0_9FUNG|nr:hypothetical protein H4R18_003341 [Coemansia javaensis]
MNSNIGDLPDDILVLVLGQAHDAERLGASLGLVAVCRRWRRVGLPVVYRWAQCGSGSGRASSVELAAAVGCAGLVRRVGVEAHGAAGLRAAAGTLGRAGAAGVAELDLAGSDGAGPEGGDLAAAEERDLLLLARAADLLARAAPGVRRLRVGAGCGRRLGGRVAAAFARRLQALSCAGPIDVPAGCVFAQLRSADLACSGMPPPRIDPRALRRLRLTGLRPAFAWAPFAAAGGGGGGDDVAEFPALRSLVLEYAPARKEDDDDDDDDDGSSDDGGPVAALLPAVAHVRVRCAADTCAALGRARLPAHVDTLDLQLSAAAAQRAALPRARRTALSVGRGDAEAAERVVQRIMGGRTTAAAAAPDPDPRAEELKLALADPRAGVAPDAVRGAGLTHLAVAAPTSIGTVAALIAALPALTSACFTDATLEAAPLDAARDGPLATRLARLTLGFGRCRLLRARIVDAAQYLMLRTPSLVRLTAPQVPRPPLESFVRALAAQYPHLAGIELY